MSVCHTFDSDTWLPYAESIVQTYADILTCVTVFKSGGLAVGKARREARRDVPARKKLQNAGGGFSCEQINIAFETC